MVHKSNNMKEKDKKIFFKEKPGKDKLSILKHKLEEKFKEVEENKELALRIKAEFDNYKKRVLKEDDEKICLANESLIRRLLSVVDTFERALNIEKKEDEKFISFYNGIQLIYKQLLDIFLESGLTVISPEKGDLFDPAVHEAVMMEDVKGHKNDIVLEVLEKGYKLSARLLRAAKVKVGRSGHAGVKG